MHPCKRLIIFSLNGILKTTAKLTWITNWCFVKLPFIFTECLYRSRRREIWKDILSINCKSIYWTTHKWRSYDWCTSRCGTAPASDLHKFSSGELYSFRGATCGTRVWILWFQRLQLHLTRSERGRSSDYRNFNASVVYHISCLIGRCVHNS